MEEDRPCSWLAADCWEQLTCAIVYVKGTTKQVKDLHCELKGQLSGGKSGSTEDHEDLQELEDELIALESEQEGERTDALEQETNNDSSDQ